MQGVPSIFLTLLSIASFTQAVAPISTDSPLNAEYVAIFKDHPVRGNVTFQTTGNSTVGVTVQLDNLPEEGGPFLYHVHQKPVPSDGNCTGTLGHLNPYNGSATAVAANEKEVGDLSGKHGPIDGTSVNVFYIDQYLSLDPSDPAFVGGLSVVVHFANETRLSCANITNPHEKSSDSGSSSASSSGSSTVSGHSSPSGAAGSGSSSGDSSSSVSASASAKGNSTSSKNGAEAVNQYSIGSFLSIGLVSGLISLL